MKSLGIITYCYPFLASESRDTLDGLIKESDHYFDFTLRLAEIALIEDISGELAYIAVRHAYEATGNAEVLRGKYYDYPLIRPWLIPIRSVGEAIEVGESLETAINAALETDSPDWIKMELLLLRVKLFMNVKGEPDFSIALDGATRFLLNNLDEHSDIFMAYIHQANGMRLLTESQDEAMKEFENALILSKSADNPIHTATLLYQLGNQIKSFDAKRAMDMLVEACEISRDLGHPYVMQGPLNVMSLIAATVGEYDLALNSLFEAIRMKREKGGQIHELAVNAANICNNMGLAQEALEWAANVPYNAHGRVQMARALISLDRVDEALEHLDYARESALKSGYSTYFADLGYGLYYFAKGDLELALTTLEQVEKEINEEGLVLHLQTCLSALVRIEIELWKRTSGNSTDNNPGQWLCRMEETAHERGYLGMIVESAILRAEFRKLQGRIDEARDILQDALEISKKPSMRTFYKRINTQIEELQIMHNSNQQHSTNRKRKYRKSR